MADLDPAAQQVRYAAIYAGPELDLRIAAALRAAADQIAPTKQNYLEASDLLAATCLNGMAYAANELRLIAAELEGGNV